MGFRSIEGSLDRRRTNLETIRRTTKSATKLIRDFLEETYGSTVAAQCRVSYTESTITVLAPAKNIARDLTLRSRELAAVVRAQKFSLTHLVIR